MKQNEMSEMTKEQMKDILGGAQKTELRAELQKILADNDEDYDPCKKGGCYPGCVPGGVHNHNDSPLMRSYPLLK